MAGYDVPNSYSNFGTKDVIGHFDTFDASWRRPDGTYSPEPYFSFHPAAVSAPAPATPSSVPQIPEPSLAGQTWGHIIPITAGKRTIPGRIVEQRITRGSDGHYTFDGLISHGFRAEIMVGDDPEVFAADRFLANGVVLRDVSAGVTAPGVTITIGDGTQTTADPFWEAIYGAGNVPAYVYHILVNVEGLPLEQFKDQRPDAWALEVHDVFADNITAIFPVYDAASLSPCGVLSNSDRTLTGNGNFFCGGLANAGRSATALTGRTYWEVVFGQPVGGVRFDDAGVGQASHNMNLDLQGSTDAACIRANGTPYYNGSPLATSLGNFENGDIAMIVFDADTRELWVGKNGTWSGGGDPALGTGAVVTLPAGTYYPMCSVYYAGDRSNSFVTVNTYPVPTGAASVDGITLARWFELLGGLTSDLVGKVTIGSGIDDVLDSMFLVDPQTTFNRDGLAMCRATGCDMRENNEGVEITRAVNGTTYSVDLALTESVILRAPSESGITFTRVGEADIPSEIRLQAIASEATYKFTERPARQERGPKPTTTSTKIDTIRIQAGMPINQIQTYASDTLYRETEARDQLGYKLPWAYAIKVQAGDVHTVPEDALLHTVKVTRADRQPNRTVAIQAQRLNTAQDYVGVTDIGVSTGSFYTSNIEVTPGAGALVWTGYPPTVSVFDAVLAVSPTTGDLTWTGNAPTVSVTATGGGGDIRATTDGTTRATTDGTTRVLT